MCNPHLKFTLDSFKLDPLCEYSAIRICGQTFCVEWVLLCHFFFFFLVFVLFVFCVFVVSVFVFCFFIRIASSSNQRITKEIVKVNIFLETFLPYSFHWQLIRE